MSTHEFFHSTKVVFGNSTVNKTGEEAIKLGAQRALVVCDKIMIETGIAGKVLSVLEESGIRHFVFDDVVPNPRDTGCVEAAELGKRNNVDIVIGLGGGSSMDTAKAAAVLITNGGICQDWDNVPLKKDILPLICIPTTAGTGSEVTFTAVITDTKRKFKMGMYDPERLAARVAIADPELTISVPAKVTASTGMDALTHAIEAYTCKAAQPITDALALYAIELISGNIEAAVKDGKDINAREKMLMGSLVAGMAFGNSNVGAVHAIAETIGGRYDTPHGVANSIFLPHVMEYNISANVEKHAVIARYLGVDVSKLTLQEAAGAGVKKVIKLSQNVGIPKFNELSNIVPDDFEKLAQASADNFLSDDNCREIGYKEYLDILHKAYHA